MSHTRCYKSCPNLILVYKMPNLNLRRPVLKVKFYPSVNLREPLINYVMSLAHRLIRNQGATLTACARLVKSCTKSRRTSDAECGSACEPQRASPEAHIYRVALLAKDLGHLLRSASCSCTLQDSQRYDIIN